MFGSTIIFLYISSVTKRCENIINNKIINIVQNGFHVNSWKQTPRTGVTKIPLFYKPFPCWFYISTGSVKNNKDTFILFVLEIQFHLQQFEMQ